MSNVTIGDVNKADPRCRKFKNIKAFAKAHNLGPDDEFNICIIMNTGGLDSAIWAFKCLPESELPKIARFAYLCAEDTRPQIHDRTILRALNLLKTSAETGEMSNEDEDTLIGILTKSTKMLALSEPEYAVMKAVTAALYAGTACKTECIRDTGMVAIYTRRVNFEYMLVNQMQHFIEVFK